MKKPPSTRSLGHITLECGLLNTQISLYAGKDASSGVSRHQYISVPVVNEDGTPKQVEVITDEGPTLVDAFEDHSVGNGNIDKTTGELLAKGTVEIIKKIDTEYGPVFVEDDEIEGLFELAPNTLVVKAFQPLALFHQGQYVPRDLNFVEPRKTGSGAKKGYDKNFSKVLNALYEGMRKEGVFAMCELTTRGVPKPCALLPDSTLWLLYHTDELREQREVPEVPVNDAEIDFVRSTFIEPMRVNDVMEINDERSALIQAFADEKAAAGDFGRPAAVEVETVEAAPAPMDLMAQLMASVQAAEGKQEAV